MSDYEKECIFCKAKIRMSDETGKWLPYELDSGKAHDCRTNANGNGNSKTNGQIQNQKYTLDEVQKRLESIGIIINVERLMAQK
jgi:hypothetical protein